MSNIFKKRTACFLLFIMFFYLIITAIPASPVTPTARASISSSEIKTGVGIALFLFLLSRVGDTLDSRSNRNISDDEDLSLLARIIFAEAEGEPYEGRVAVGAVVLNRVASPLFPNTIRDVIYQARQFSPIHDGRFYRITPDENAYRAAKEAMNGSDPSRDALFFYNPETASSTEWFEENTVITRTIANHAFARYK